MDLEAIGKSLAFQFSAVTSAPIPFLLAVAVVGFLVWKLVQWQFETRLSHAQSKQELSDARVADYERKLAGASPDEARARFDALEQALAKLQPRDITADQQRKISDAAPFAGHKISILADSAAPDAKRLMHKLAQAYEAAGWDVYTGVIMGEFGPPTPTGLRATVTDPTAITEAEQVMLAGLKAAGIKFDLGIGPNAPSVLITNPY